MYFIGLDVHKKTISYCVKNAAGRVHQEGKIGSTRRGLANEPCLLALAQEIMGSSVFPFRATLFDKSSDAN